MRRLLAVCLAALALSAGVDGARADPAGEGLLMPVPQGFAEAYRAGNGAEEIVEFVPAGETVDTWTRLVTVQTFHKLKNVDPNAFAEIVAKGWRGACPGATIAVATHGMQNGYPFVLWTLGCPRNPQTGKPESVVIKAIGGGDSLYSVQYAYRKVLTDETTRPMIQFLEQVRACDTRHVEHPCPLR